MLTSLNLCYRAQKPAPFTLCSERARRPVLISFSRTLILLILLLLCSSGDVEVNPGPAVPSSTPTPQVLSFIDFGNRKSLGFVHVNIRSLLPKFVFLAVSESWLRKTTKNLEISIANYSISVKIELPKRSVLQSTAQKPAEFCITIQVCTQTIQASTSKNHLSRNKSLTVSACYRPPSAPS